LWYIETLKAISMKRIALFGSGGLIGSTLMSQLKDQYEIKPVSSKLLYSNPEILSKQIINHDVIINLTGHSIGGMWTPKKKKLISDSRTITTQNLADAINVLDKKPQVYINASGVGIYADGEIVDEASSHFANDFLAELVKKFEKNILKVKGLSPSIVRFGVILSKRGGAYPQFRKIMESGFGGRVGNGQQGMSVVHIDDAIRAIDFIIKNQISGIVNISCPNPTTNNEFTTVLAKKLAKPSFFRIPVILLKIRFLEGHILLTKGQKVVPSVLLKNGFQFQYPDVYNCIQKLEE
jgi:uncharacterized protein